MKATLSIWILTVGIGIALGIMAADGHREVFFHVSTFYFCIMILFYVIKNDCE